VSNAGWFLFLNRGSNLGDQLRWYLVHAMFRLGMLAALAEYFLYGFTSRLVVAIHSDIAASYGLHRLLLVFTRVIIYRRITFLADLTQKEKQPDPTDENPLSLSLFSGITAPLEPGEPRSKSPDETEDWIVYHAMHRPDGGWRN